MPTNIRRAHITRAHKKTHTGIHAHARADSIGSPLWLIFHFLAWQCVGLFREFSPFFFLVIVDIRFPRVLFLRGARKTALVNIKLVAEYWNFRLAPMFLRGDSNFVSIITEKETFYSGSNGSISSAVAYVGRKVRFPIIQNRAKSEGYSHFWVWYEKYYSRGRSKRDRRGILCIGFRLE